MTKEEKQMMQAQSELIWQLANNAMCFADNKPIVFALLHIAYAATDISRTIYGGGCEFYKDNLKALDKLKSLRGE